MWRCGHPCSVCVCCVVGNVWGGCGACRWAMGESVVDDPPHPHHSNLYHALVGLGGGSYGKCCGGVRACVSDAAACCGVRRCSASLPAVCGALQCRIRPPPCPICHPNAAPTHTTVSGVVWYQWGIGDHLPTRSCGLRATHLRLGVRRFLGASVFLVPGATRRRPQATRTADAAGSPAAWAWEGWGRVDVREGRSGEGMGGGKRG